jgi:hypothetical protein
MDACAHISAAIVPVCSVSVLRILRPARGPVVGADRAAEGGGLVEERIRGRDTAGQRRGVGNRFEFGVVLLMVSGGSPGSITATRFVALNTKLSSISTATGGFPAGGCGAGMLVADVSLWNRMELVIVRFPASSCRLVSTSRISGPFWKFIQM